MKKCIFLSYIMINLEQNFERSVLNKNSMILHKIVWNENIQLKIILILY